MYRDKTSRKQLTRSAGMRLPDRASAAMKHPVLPPEISEGEIERARAGVL
jgi:hypothetical protein